MRKIIVDLAITGHEAAMPDWDSSATTVRDEEGSPCGYVDTVEGNGRLTIFVDEDACAEHESFVPQEGDRAYSCDDDRCRLAPHMAKSPDGAYRFHDGAWTS
jgi:hypothetical protein